MLYHHVGSTSPRRCFHHRCRHHHHHVGPYEAPGGILTMRVDNRPPPMPVRSPWPRMARQGWAASSTIHPRARMATFRKTPSPKVTISKMVSTSPTVSTSSRRCRNHHHHHHHHVGPYEAPGGILTMSADNRPPPMPVRSPRPPMTRQGWAASSMIHPRARMATGDVTKRDTPTNPRSTHGRGWPPSGRHHLQKSPSQRWSATSPCGQHVTGCPSITTLSAHQLDDASTSDAGTTITTIIVWGHTKPLAAS